ncbi:MAG: UbiA family prenyltransferase [Candidatus Micrarchaeota archaeon]|nr:UbiA family prenyltransferase [Candidatus Micrarchaeota archaeon]
MDARSFFSLVRMDHGFAIAAAIIVGEILAGGALPPLSLAVMSIIPPMLVQMALFALNDYLDYEADKANKRNDRPIVSGRVKRHEAFGISMLLLLFGLLFSYYFISFGAFLIVFAFSALGIAYDYSLKGSPLLGNMYIGASMAIPFVYGSVVVSGGVGPAIIVLASMAFLAGTGREIGKTVQDMEGDAKAKKAKTLPIAIGARNALALQALFYATAIGISAVPFLYLPPYEGDYKYLVFAGISDLLFTYVALMSLLEGKKFMAAARRESLKATYIGILAFIAGIF